MGLTTQNNASMNIGLVASEMRDNEAIGTQ